MSTARDRHRPYRRCVKRCGRRTHAKSRICLSCRESDMPEVAVDPKAIRVGRITLSHTAARRLADLIHDTIEQQELENTDGIA